MQRHKHKQQCREKRDACFLDENTVSRHILSLCHLHMTTLRYVVHSVLATKCCLSRHPEFAYCIAAPRRPQRRGRERGACVCPRRIQNRVQPDWAVSLYQPIAYVFSVGGLLSLFSRTKLIRSMYMLQ